MTDASNTRHTSESERKNLALEVGKVPIWQQERYRFVSLFDIVKPFDSHKLFLAARALEEIIFVCADNQRLGHQQVHDVNNGIILSHLDNLVELIADPDLGLAQSLKQVDRMKKALSLPNCAYDHIMRLTHELQSRIQDELDAPRFMYFTLSDIALYQDINPFGEEVATNFGSANFDIEEAAKCFAASRYTACVFHLMRVLEVALKAVAKGLGIPDPVKEADRNWGGILRRIKDAIEQKDKTNDPTWLQDKDFYKNAYTDLTAVRTAWRNPTMHVESKYDDQRAGHIYNVVMGFMKHLADKLCE